jgi:predicted nucleotidyltransferase
MNSLKYLTTNEKNALNALVSKLKEKLKSQLVQIKIFGSKVRGTFQEDSDIDVLLILQERTEAILDTIAAIHLEIELQYNLTISLVIYSQHEFETNERFESPFVKNIQRESVSL